MSSLSSNRWQVVLVTTNTDSSIRPVRCGLFIRCTSWAFPPRNHGFQLPVCRRAVVIISCLCRIARFPPSSAFLVVVVLFLQINCLHAHVWIGTVHFGLDRMFNRISTRKRSVATGLADTDYEILFRSRQLGQFAMTGLKVIVCDYHGPRLWMCPKMIP